MNWGDRRSSNTHCGIAMRMSRKARKRRLSGRVRITLTWLYKRKFLAPQSSFALRGFVMGLKGMLITILLQISEDYIATICYTERKKEFETMKKAVCVLLAAVCCCTMSSPFVAYAQTSDVLSFEEAVALDAERTRLFQEMNEAVYRNDAEEAERLEGELAEIGMKEISRAEAQDLLEESNSGIELLEKEYEDDKYKYFEGNVDMFYHGVEYSYTVMNISPKLMSCSLVKSGYVDEFIPDYGYLAWKMLFELAGDVVSTAVGSVPVLGVAAGYADILANLVDDVSDFFVDENSTNRVSSSYDWFIVENVSLIISKVGTNTKRTIGFFNSISGEVSGYVNLIDSSGHLSVAKREKFSESIYWHAPNFGSGGLALAHYVDTGTRYEVKVDSIDIKSPTNKGTILHTIKLQNPLSLNEIY